jgi:hypothetical protein
MADKKSQTYCVLIDTNPSLLEIPTNYDNHTHPQIPNAESKQRARPLEQSDEGKASGTGRPRVCFSLLRTRLLDTDAKYGSVKDVLDGLAYAGLIPGDREDQITLEVQQVKVAHRKDESTVIQITYP